jgi:hypothetical protein
VSLPADLISGGGEIELTVRKDKGANAVLCEMWLLATP